MITFTYKDDIRDITYIVDKIRFDNKNINISDLRTFKRLYIALIHNENDPISISAEIDILTTWDFFNHYKPLQSLIDNLVHNENKVRANADIKTLKIDVWKHMYEALQHKYFSLKRNTYSNDIIRHLYLNQRLDLYLDDEPKFANARRVPHQDEIVNYFNGINVVNIQSKLDARYEEIEINLRNSNMPYFISRLNELHEHVNYIYFLDDSDIGYREENFIPSVDLATFKDLINELNLFKDGDVWLDSQDIERINEGSEFRIMYKKLQEYYKIIKGKYSTIPTELQQHFKFENNNGQFSYDISHIKITLIIYLRVRILFRDNDMPFTPNEFNEMLATFVDKLSTCDSSELYKFNWRIQLKDYESLTIQLIDFLNAINDFITNSENKIMPRQSSQKREIKKYFKLGDKKNSNLFGIGNDENTISDDNKNKIEKLILSIGFDENDKQKLLDEFEELCNDPSTYLN